MYSQLKEYHNAYLFSLNVWSDAYFAFYKFIAKEFEIDAAINSELELFSSAFESSNIYSAIFSEAVCVVSKYPKKVSRNSSNDLHSSEGPAVQWGSYSPTTDFDLFYINGRNISKIFYNKIINNELSFEEFSKISNEDEKGITLTLIKETRGNKGMLDFLNAILIDCKIVKHTNEYSETIKLYKTKQKYSFLQNSKGELDQPYAWINLVCPSTGTEYFIDTCPTFTDAVECAKWHRPKQIPMNLEYQWLSAN